MDKGPDEELEGQVQDLEYELWKEEVPETDKFEEYLDLLYRYLKDYISREVLSGDLRYCFEKGRVVGTYNEDMLVGAAAGVYTPFFDKFHIAHIAVEEEYQGKGIGSELTEELIPEEKEAAVHLNIDNPEIKKFYKKLGFEPTHTRFKRVGDGKPSD